MGRDFEWQSKLYHLGTCCSLISWRINFAPKWGDNNFIHHRILVRTWLKKAVHRWLVCLGMYPTTTWLSTVIVVSTLSLVIGLIVLMHRRHFFYWPVLRKCAISTTYDSNIIHVKEKTHTHTYDKGYLSFYIYVYISTEKQVAELDSVGQFKKTTNS